MHLVVQSTYVTFTGLHQHHNPRSRWADGATAKLTVTRGEKGNQLIFHCAALESSCKWSWQLCELLSCLPARPLYSVWTVKLKNILTDWQNWWAIRTDIFPSVSLLTSLRMNHGNRATVAPTCPSSHRQAEQPHIHFSYVTSVLLSAYTHTHTHSLWLMSLCCSELTADLKRLPSFPFTTILSHTLMRPVMRETESSCFQCV